MVFFFIYTVILNAQITGIVKNSDSIPIEYVNVALYSLPDSILKKGTVTDSLGNFTIFENDVENTFLKFSMIGYSPEIVATKPFQTIVLNASSTQLSEITVSAQIIQSFGSKDNLIIPASIKEKSASALSAIGQMPQFRLNVLSNVLETVDNQKIIILINGTNASEQELMSIQPQDVRRIEHYTQPPARYANLNAGAVINVITRTPDASGFSGMINTKNSFTTGYGTNTVNAKWYNEHNQLSLNYFIDYRNLDDNRINQNFEYRLDGMDYKNTYKGLPGSYKGEYHIFRVNYINHRENNYTFSAKTTYRINPGKENHTQETTVIENDNEPIIGEASKLLKSNYNSISTDLYFSKTLPNEQEITANVVGTHFNSTSMNELSRNLPGEQGNYTYINDIKNTSGSVIGEAFYNKQFRKQNFTIGGRYFYKNLKQTYNSGNKYSLSQQKLYAYSGLSGSINKINYNAEIGVEHSIQSISSEESAKQFTVLKPSISASYALSKSSSIRLNSLLQSNTPDISSLTTTPIYLNYKYASIGNSNLKPYYTLYNRLQYQLSLPKFFLSTSARNSYLINPYLITLQDKGTEIIRTWDVKESMSYTALDINSRWTPLEWLTIQPYFSVGYSQFANNDGTSFNDWSKMLSISATFTYKNFKLLSQWGSSYTNLQGDFIEKRMPYYVGELSWTKNQATFALQYIHNPNPIISYSNSNILKFREETIWNNFQNLITVSFVYSFTSEKESSIRENQKMNNQDNDSGLRNEQIAK
ncbi:hypothetical protein D7D25_16680 [Proteiniphilum sp. X52]|nr:hypothetical protein D7D25_16680 [Proteiniphilum sp. X52]